MNGGMPWTCTTCPQWVTPPRSRVRARSKSKDQEDIYQTELLLLFDLAHAHAHALRSSIRPKELIAEFWLWKCESLQEAIDWVKRCPNPMPGEEAEIEIRQVFEAEDFAAKFVPEHREEAERVYKQVSRSR